MAAAVAVAASHDFGFDLYARVKADKENVIRSPASPDLT